MSAPTPHNLDFDPTPASAPRGSHDEAGEGILSRMGYPDRGVYTPGDNPVGQGVNTTPRSVAEDSRPPV